MRSFVEPERNQLLLLTNVNIESVAPVGSAVRTIVSNGDKVPDIDGLKVPLLRHK